MVYRGKPSKACLPCRKRKLVCDLKLEGCSQCRRANLLCHGYRDTGSLRLKDESIAIIRKVQGGTTSRTNPPRLDLAPVFRHAGAIPQSLSIPMASQARDLFYYNYVVGSLKPFDFVEALCSPTSKDEHLTTSMDAVALAYLNYQRHAPDAQSAARRSYVSALRLMNNAIQDPQLAKKDSTVLACLLLDLYEKITNHKPDSKGGWSAHLRGAIILVNMRGSEQFNDPIALRMLARITTSGVISSVNCHEPIPVEIIVLRAKISSLTLNPSPKARETDLMIDLAALSHELEAGSLSDSDAISAIHNLDQRFSALSLDVELGWQYKTVFVDKMSSHHWEAHHHVYPHEQIVQMWNVLRLARIMLNESILSFATADGAETSLDALSWKQHASAVIGSMISDICASVPQYIGSGELSAEVTNKLATTAVKASTHEHSTGPNPTQHLPCYRLIYPLYVAARSAASPRALLPWVISQLQFMADYHGIRNAARVAGALDSGEQKDPWLVYAMLGSYAFVC